MIQRRLDAVVGDRRDGFATPILSGDAWTSHFAAMDAEVYSDAPPVFVFKRASIRSRGREGPGNLLGGGVPKRSPMWREWIAVELIGPLSEVGRKNTPERLFLAGDAALLRFARLRHNSPSLG